MNVIDRIRGGLARLALKAAGGNIQLLPQWVRHSSFFPSFSTIVREAYRKNATAFACTMILQKTFPEPELWAWRENEDSELEKIPRHPLRLLLRKPNLDMGEMELMQFGITYCSLGGNVYLWKQRSASRKVVALWPLHDGQMTPIGGHNTEEGLVAYYVLDDGSGEATDPLGIGRHEGENTPGIAIAKEDVIHWKWAIDPSQPWRGIGALVAAASDVDIANELNALVLSSLKNDAVPPLVVNLVEGAEFDEDKAKRLRRQWQRQHSGAMRGLPAFLEFGMTATKLGFDPATVDVSDLKAGPDAAICMGYGIHPTIVGAMVGLEHSTYSNYEEASRALAEKTLIPLWRSFASEFEQAMRDEPGFGKDVLIRFDVDSVGALQQDLDALWTRTMLAFDGSAITRGEARTALGFKVNEEVDNVYKETLGMMLVDATKKPEEREPAPSPFGQGGGEEEPEGEERQPEKAQKPYPNEHACRLRSPDLFQEGSIRSMTRNHDGKEYRVLVGKLKGETTMTEQAYRYAKSTWSASEARSHCGDHDGSFEAASGEEDAFDWTTTCTASFGDGLRGASTRRATPAQRAKIANFIGAMRSLRDELERRMRDGLVMYFDGLASSIIGRLEESGAKQAKTDLTADAFMDLIFRHSDREQLRRIIAEYRLEIVNSSWTVLNATLQSGVAFDLTNPAVTEVLGMTSDQVKWIDETTRDTLRSALQGANERGWSIQQMIAGDDEIPPLRQIVEQVYKNRDRAIARTELGNAQNIVAHSRYAAAGVEHVIVFDNGFENSAPDCVMLDGTIQTLAWARANPLGHPNCVRAFGPLFD